MNWWLYSKQEEYKSAPPVIFIAALYVIAIVTGLIIRATTWPDNEPVTLLFLVPSVLLPASVMSVITFLVLMIESHYGHYAETKKLIADTREVDLKAYACGNLAIAAWSSITPLEQPALNMLKLEGEFPLAPKTPLKIDVEVRFEQTPAEQLFSRLLSPMAAKLTGTSYRSNFDAVVWVKGSDGGCVDALRRTLQSLNVPNASTCKITHLEDCPDYSLIDESIKWGDRYSVNRLVVMVDLHEEGSESKSMESASAFLLTNHYVNVEGEKTVYLYQPMTAITDVEEDMPVYLQVAPVVAPKVLWHTGLSRVEKYALTQLLDEKKLAANRVDAAICLGKPSTGYRWLLLAMAADAVKYVQGEQLVAASETGKFAMAALSARKADVPERSKWGTWTLPVQPALIASLFFILSAFFYQVSFGSAETAPSLWGLLAWALLPILIGGGMGTGLMFHASHEAYKAMGWR